jgi:hypothetical protein
MQKIQKQKTKKPNLHGLLYNHEIRGKVHYRAIPGSWKKQEVFSKGSQDSPPGSLG